MAKTTRHHRCIDCGATTIRWAGRCPGCGEWNTLVEESRLDPLVRAVDELELPMMPVALSAIDAVDAAAVPTGVDELDRVLSGGLVPGSVTLIGGEPGIGKSTLLLQALMARASTNQRVLLVSAEESAHQVRLRAERLGTLPPDLFVLPVTDMGAVVRAVAECRPDLVAIDSIQAVSVGRGEPDGGDRRPTGAPGSPAQVRECAEALVSMAKTHNVATVLIGHVTKDGSLAGPRTLEHMVDTVLSFEGDRHHALRLLLTTKHRFGPTGELGLFEMGEHGLHPVDDPGKLLLGDRLHDVSGATLLPAAQGRRTLVVELQALVASTVGDKVPPKRFVVGVDPGRLVMVLAVLQRHAGVAAIAADVFASVAGGIRVTEPAADLALALAVASAASGKPLPADLAAVGEIGLSGEVRQVTNLPRRLEECSRLGLSTVVVPASAPDGPPGLTLVRVESVSEALGRLSI